MPCFSGNLLQALREFTHLLRTLNVAREEHNAPNMAVLDQIDDLRRWRGCGKASANQLANLFFQAQRHVLIVTAEVSPYSEGRCRFPLPARRLRCYRESDVD